MSRGTLLLTRANGGAPQRITDPVPGLTVWLAARGGTTGL